MTAQQTLRAALEDYSRFLEEAGYLDSDWRDEPPSTVHRFMATNAAKSLEAMEQHRRETIDELVAWCESREPLIYWQEIMRHEALGKFKSKIAELKT